MNKIKSKINQIGENNFSKNVLRHKGLVVVEFSSKSSGACHMVAPIMKKTSEKYYNDVKFCKVDYDTYMELSEKYRVNELPSVVVFNNGRVVDMIKGIFSDKLIDNKIKILKRNNIIAEEKDNKM